MKNQYLVNFSNECFSSNTDNFPFIYIEMKEKRPTDKEFDEYLTTLNNLYLQDEKFTFLMKFTGKGGYLKSEHRIKLGNWIKKNKERMSIQCKGAAFVTDSALHKFLLQAIFSVQKPPYEYIVTKEDEKAKEWLKKQLEK